MNLAEVNRGIKKNKKRKRVGRGTGSGHGKTCGRGHKGQGQLAGWTVPPTFEGGKSPLIRRIPKRGFNNKFGRVVVAVNVGQLAKSYNSGESVTPESLRDKNLAKGRYDELKILGGGELDKKLKISAHRFSAQALEKIKQAGGEAIVLATGKAKAAPPAASPAADDKTDE